MVYEQPIYPKNLYLERAPYTHAEYKKEVTERQIRPCTNAASGCRRRDSCAEQQVERAATAG